MHFCEESAFSIIVFIRFYIFFVSGLLSFINASSGEGSDRFIQAWRGALLMALAIFMKPFVAPACVVIVSGAMVNALYRSHWKYAVGLCVGLSLILFMPWH